MAAPTSTRCGPRSPATASATSRTAVSWSRQVRPSQLSSTASACSRRGGKGSLEQVRGRMRPPGRKLPHLVPPLQEEGREYASAAGCKGDPPLRLLPSGGPTPADLFLSLSFPGSDPACFLFRPAEAL